MSKLPMYMMVLNAQRRQMGIVVHDDGKNVFAELDVPGATLDDDPVFVTWPKKEVFPVVIDQREMLPC